MKSPLGSKVASALSAGALFILAQCLVAVGITRDIPVGGLTGTVFMAENNRPLSGALVALRGVSPYDGSTDFTATAEADADGRFEFRGLPTGSYYMDISADCHSLDKSKLVTVEEGKKQTIRLSAIPEEEELRVGSPERVYLPEEQPVISIYGHFQESGLNYELKRAPVEALIESGSIYQLYSGKTEGKLGFELIKNGTLELKNRDIEGQFELRHRLDALEQGLYIFEATRSPSKDNPFPLRSATFFYVSRIGALVKKGSVHTDAFVIDLKTGEPIPNAQVKLYVGTSLNESNKTDSQGLCRLPSTKGVNNNNRVLVASSGAGTAIVNFSEYESSDGITAHFITDRPIYRPGDSIHFKGILRKPVSELYELPTVRTAHVTATNSDEEQIFEADVEISEFGTIVCDFAAPETEAEGINVSVQVGNDREFHYIPVTAYRKPEFKVTVTPEKPFYYRGEALRFKLKAEYYFGSPVANAKVDLSIFQGDLWAWHDSMFDETDEYAYDDDYVDTLEVHTDANGEATVEIPAEKFPFGKDADTDRSVRLEATVAAANNRFAEGEGEVTIRRGAFDLRLETAGWLVEPGQAFSARIIAIDVATEKPAAGVSVSIEYGPQVWVNEEYVMHKEGLRTLATNAEGVAELRITPEKEGFYRIKAKGVDSANRPVATSEYFACLSDAYSGDFSQGDIGLSILLDKKTYKPGENVRAMIVAPGKTGKAWVTMEGLDVMQQTVVSLERTLTPVVLKVPQVAAPNAFISVSLVRGKAFEQAGKSVSIGLESRTLNVDLTPSEEVLKPGQTATLEVRVTDSSGKPVASELSLGVVDEAVFAIREDHSDPIETFYPRRWGGVPLYDSFPTVYLDGGDKGTKNVEIRKDFRDTAEWLGRVITDSNGQAKLKVKLPDNLTSWRFTANAVTRDTKAAKAKTNVRVRKEIMVRLATPVQLIEGDTYEIIATVNSDMDKPLSASVSLKAEGAASLAGSEQKVELDPKGEAVVKWQLTATRGDAIKLTAVAIAAPFSDGMEIEFPVRPRRIFMSVGGFGFLRSDEPAEVRPSIGKDPVKAQVSLNSNPQDSMLSSLAELIDYPYGCVEQTLSRFVPAVVVKAAAGGSDLPTKVSVDDVVQRGLARLRMMQLEDGGWGWWENDNSNGWMTGMVLEGLFYAKQSGVEVPQAMLNRGLDWAERALGLDPPKAEGLLNSWYEDSAYLAYGLILHGRSAGSFTKRPARKDESLDTISLRFLAACNSGEQDAADKLYAQLRKRANVADGRVDWAPEEWGHSCGPRVLEGLAMLHPDHPDLDSILVGLLSQRKGRFWQNTYDTAQSIRAIVRTLGNSFIGGSFTANVNKNGQILFSEANPARRVLDVDLTPGDTLQFSRQGDGTLLYDWTAKVAVETDLGRPESSSKGLSIRRTFHKLVSEKVSGDRRTRFVTGPISNRFRTGDTVVCRVVVKTDVARGFSLVDVPLPGNVSVVQDAGDEWYYWFSGKQVFDDRVALFDRWLPEGESVFEILMRAESVGKCAALPARFERMYVPSINARSETAILEVTP